jgi:hypothetical protein
VDILNAEIGSDQKVMADPRAQDGAVVADSAHLSFIGRTASQLSDSLDQLPFFHFVASLPTACEFGRLWLFRRL